MTPSFHDPAPGGCLVDEVSALVVPEPIEGADEPEVLSRLLYPHVPLSLWLILGQLMFMIWLQSRHIPDQIRNPYFSFFTLVMHRS